MNSAPQFESCLTALNVDAENKGELDRKTVVLAACRFPGSQQGLQEKCLNRYKLYPAAVEVMPPNSCLKQLQSVI